MTTDAQNQTQMPNLPGEWFFTGKAILPHSTTPGNTTTVHIDTPRRFLMVETPYGLIPHEPANHYPYPHVEFVGTWTKGHAP